MFWPLTSIDYPKLAGRAPSLAKVVAHANKANTSQLRNGSGFQRNCLKNTKLRVHIEGCFTEMFYAQIVS